MLEVADGFGDGIQHSPGSRRASKGYMTASSKGTYPSKMEVQDWEELFQLFWLVNRWRTPKAHILVLQNTIKRFKRDRHDSDCLTISVDSQRTPSH